MKQDADKPRPRYTRAKKPDSEPEDEASELARLLPLWPHEVSDRSIEGRCKIIAALDKALRAERRRGNAGHWAYDVARHAALYRIWKRQRAVLRDLQSSKTAKAHSITPRKPSNAPTVE